VAPHAAQQVGLVRQGQAGGTDQRVHIHKLPQTAPQVAGLIEGILGRGGQRSAVGVGTASGGAKSERNQARRRDVIGPGITAFAQVRGSVAGTGFEPVKALPAILQTAPFGRSGTLPG
jgi:hypothetical protein